MYFVTTFTKLEKNHLGWWEFGSKRTVGYYENLEDARYVVCNNVCDLCETIYSYAIIESVEQGLYPRLIYQELFRVHNKTKEVDGIAYYNPDLTYEPIPIPEDFPKYSLVIG